MHLAAAADALDFFSVKTGQQLGNSLENSLFPVFGSLLAPAGMGKLQGILLGDRVQDAAFFVHQQELDCGCTQINADIQTR